MIKAIALGMSGLLLMPVLVIGAIAGGSGGSSISVAVADGELASEILDHPAIQLTSNARRDVAAGIVDVRVLRLLVLLAERFEVGPVGPLISGHSHFVKGTSRVSNHVYGRAVDILGIDGAPVSPANPSAREAMKAILELPEALQPDELGGPWLLNNGRLFTFTRDHLDHLHAGWDS